MRLHDDGSIGGLEALARRPRVLVAEDDDELRRMITDVLSADGFEVSQARDGRELVEIAHASLHEDGALPDLIVTDVRMPGLSGLDALAALGPLLGRTAVLVVTAFSDVPTQREATRMGAMGVLDKPFEIDDLRVAAHNCRAWSAAHRLRGAR